MRSAVLRPKVLLALFAVLFSALAAEVVLRIGIGVKAVRKNRTLEELGATRPPGEEADASLAELLRPSPNQKLLYELRPDLRTRFKGKSLATDSRGFRSTGPGPEGQDAVRILGLGDSVMFGWGVSDAETFLARLSSSLAERFPQATWEATNTAVPGYNTAMEVEVLREKGLPQRPHLVILSWVNNDLDLPSFVRPLPSRLVINRSFLIGWIGRRFADDQVSPFGPDLVDARRHAEQYHPEYFDTLTTEQRELVGLSAVENAMSLLSATARAHDFELLVLTRGRPPRFLRKACNKLGIPTVVASSYKERFLAESELMDVHASDLTLSPTDPHPSALGHRLIAFSLSEFLTESGMAGRLIESSKESNRAARPRRH